MNKRDLMNLCYSAIIDGGNTKEPLTRETAIDTICNWIEEDILTEYIEPSYFARIYNSVLQEMKKGE